MTFIPMRQSGHGHRSEAGFTLVEMTVTLAITSILIVAIGSSMLLASRALPHVNDPERALLQAGRAIEQMAAELTHALHVVEQDARSITFIIANRTGNGASHRVRYAWSGVAGEPLTRQFDDGPATVVMDSANQFALTPHWHLVEHTYRGAVVEGVEQVLDHHADFTSIGSLRLEPGRAAGQSLMPTGSSSLLGWQVTHVHVRGLQAGWSGSRVAVQLRPHDFQGRPGSVMTQTLVNDISFGILLSNWVEVSLSSPRPFLPGQPFYLVAAHHGSSGTSIDVLHSTLLAKGGRTQTTDGGATWTAPSGNAMLFYLHGRVLSEGAAQTVRRRHLTAVEVELEPAGAVPVSTRVPLLSRPVEVQQFWRVDYERDPTTMDFNGDGVNDWVMHGGGTFSAGALAGGAWRVTHASQAIRTHPANDFAALTTVHARLQAMNTGTAEVTANVDFHASQIAPILATLTRSGGGTQTLVVACHDVGGVLQPVVQIPNLPDQLIDLRLLINPATMTVNVRVDDMDKGTYRYHRVGMGSRPRSIVAGGSDARFEHVSIATGALP